MLTAEAAPGGRVTRAAWIAVLALAVLPYLNAIPAFWVGDDYNYVVPKTLETIVNFFNAVGRAAYRPTNWLTWALDYTLFGNAPPGWHLTSLALHVLNTTLVVLLLRELARAWWPDRPARQVVVPFLTGAFFAVHPTHPETVTWTGGRADVAFAVGLFLGAWALARWRAGGRREPRLYLVAGLGVWLAIMGKEAGLVAPLALLLVDWAMPDDFFHRKDAKILGVGTGRWAGPGAGGGGYCGAGGGVPDRDAWAAGGAGQPGGVADAARAVADRPG
jgi:hypothetical protein